MLISELTEDRHGTFLFVDDQGNHFEAVPSDRGWVVWNKDQEWELGSHQEFADFMDKFDLKPVKSKFNVREKSNAWWLTGSGRADPHGKKGGVDSSAHKKVRPPSTTYSKSRKKYNAGAKPGARDGFVG